MNKLLEERLIQIVNTIIKFPYASKNELISLSNLSKRQVEYALEKINDWLKENSLDPIRFINNHLSVNPETQIRLIHLLNETHQGGIERYLLNTNERINYLCLLLFLNQEYISMNHMIEHLQVGKTTLSKDIKLLEEELEKQDISLFYTRKHGYRLDGDESAIRSMLMRLLIDCISIDGNTRLLDKFILDNHLTDFDMAYAKIRMVADQCQIHFVENRLIEFVYLFIFLKERRTSNGSHLKLGMEQTEFENSNEWKFTKMLLDDYSIHDKELQIYVTAWLLGASLGDFSNQTETNEKIIELVKEILNRFEAISGITFENRETVIKQIFLHFKSAYYRLNFRIPIINPYTQQIKSEYSDLFLLVSQTLKDFRYIFKGAIPDDEVAYLTMHFSSLISNFESSHKYEFTASVICPNGLGTSVMLYSQLQSLFPKIKFLDPVERIQLNDIINDIDLIFSTTTNFDIGNKEIPVFIVNPVMTNKEKYQIVQRVNALKRQEQKQLPDISKIMQIVEKYIDPSMIPSVEEEIVHTLISNKNHRITDETKPRLQSLIKLDYIQLGVNATDKYDAVKKAAKPLLADGVFSENYLNAMLKNMENSSYMVIAKHVALPHARIEDGAQKIGIGITVLSNYVRFDHYENDPVKYIFCLSAVDKESHLNALSTLVNILSEQEFFDMLSYATDPKLVLNYIKQFEDEKTIYEEKYSNS